MAKIPVLQGGTGKDEAPSRFAKLQKAIEDSNRNMVSVLKLIEKNTKATLVATKDLVKVSKKGTKPSAPAPEATGAIQTVKEKAPEKKQEEGNASVTMSAIAAGGLVGGAGLVDEALKKTDATPVNTAQDETNWQRMNLGQKIESGAARGIEKAGSVLSNLPLVGDQLGRVAHAAKVSRIDTETKALEGVPLPDGEMGPPSSVYEAQQAQAARDTVVGSYRRKNREQMGPPRSVFEAEQSQANQAADYAAAGRTMEQAGMKAVTGREAQNLQKGEMQPADYEQAQQAQAAREAVARGRRRAPILPKPESVEPIPSPSEPAAVSPTPRGMDRIERMREQAKKLTDTAREMGIQGKVQGRFEGGQLTKIITEDGREIDVSGKLSPEDSSKVEAARRMRSEMSGERVTQATNENRDLQSQAQTQSTQPVILNNNNTVSQQNYTPAAANPRTNSPYESFNNSRAFYR